jgi:hypothetical protein
MQKLEREREREKKGVDEIDENMRDENTQYYFRAFGFVDLC